MNADGETGDDPHLLLLGRIAGELRGIRMELEAMNDTSNTPADRDRFECRCGKVLGSEPAAKKHAKTEHKAPDGAWQHLFERTGES